MRICFLKGVDLKIGITFALVFIFYSFFSHFRRKSSSDFIRRFASYLRVFGESLVEEHNYNLIINLIITKTGYMNQRIKKKFTFLKRQNKPHFVDKRNSDTRCYGDQISEPSLIIVRSFSKAHSLVKQSLQNPKQRNRCISAHKGERYQPEYRPKKLTNTSFHKFSALKTEQNQQHLLSNQNSLSELIVCKDMLRQSQLNHQQRWKMLTSIQKKMVKGMQSITIKRYRKTNKIPTNQAVLNTSKSKSQIKFNDLIQIKQFQHEKEDICKKRKKQRRFESFFGQRQKNRLSFSKTSIQFNPLTSRKTITSSRKPFKYLNRYSFNDDNQLGGWTLNNQNQQNQGLG